MTDLKKMTDEGLLKELESAQYFYGISNDEAEQKKCIINTRNYRAELLHRFNEKKEMDKLIQLQGMYISLLSNEMDKIEPLLCAHNIKPNEQTVRRGKRFRDKIKEIQQTLNQ